MPRLRESRPSSRPLYPVFIVTALGALAGEPANNRMGSGPSSSIDSVSQETNGHVRMVRDPLSVVVSTYEWPEALDAVLRALSEQSDTRFDIVVADDGSGFETAAVVDHWRAVLGDRVAHVWHPHRGFRQALARNRGALAARGDYLVFRTGTRCRASFRASAQDEHPSRLVRRRPQAELSETLTERVLAANDPIHHHGFYSWLATRRVAGELAVVSRSAPRGHARRAGVRAAQSRLRVPPRRCASTSSRSTGSTRATRDGETKTSISRSACAVSAFAVGTRDRTPSSCTSGTRHARSETGRTGGCFERRRAASTSRPCAASASSSCPPPIRSRPRTEVSDGSVRGTAARAWSCSLRP